MSLVVYDMLGRRVRSLVDGFLPIGSHAAPEIALSIMAEVTALRNRLQTLPDSLLRHFGRFKELDYFAAGGFERTAPRIDFDS